MAKATDITSITTQLFKLLQPLESDERKRAIKATLTLLGEEGDIEPDKPKKKDEEETVVESGLPAKARTWMRQNSVSDEQLSHVFHGTDIIANVMPGTSKKEKTRSTYILTGIGQLIQTGEPQFSDETARHACKTHGCYDETNHSTTIKDRGNSFTGSKKTGWTLTTPGLKTGAELVKQIAQA
jgi:hypothetical protein